MLVDLSIRRQLRHGIFIHRADRRNQVEVPLGRLRQPGRHLESERFGHLLNFRKVGQVPQAKPDQKLARRQYCVKGLLASICSKSAALAFGHVFLVRRVLDVPICGIFVSVGVKLISDFALIA